MTLIKSLLLGSAAGIVAVASAQAADLPTRKAAPVEYVRVCNVGGITGWTLPGSDTCVKFSGYITAQFDGRQPQHPVQLWLRSETRLRLLSNPLVPQSAAVAAALASALDRVPGLPQHSAGPDCGQRRSENNQTFNRSQVGWTTRANFGFDLASNTAYGPLIGHFDINFEERAPGSTTSTTPTSTPAI